MTNIHGHYVFQQKDTGHTVEAQKLTQFIVFFAFRRYFVQGITVGGIKG